MRKVSSNCRMGLKFLVFSGLASVVTLSVSAQVERLTPRDNTAGGLSGGKARFIKSGALLLASFDANHDFEISDEEVEAGARNTFKVADADQNGVITPIEQRDWAARITGEGDVLENSRFFQSAIPNQVTEEEFVAGIKTFATTFANAEGKILFTSFTITPASRDSKREDRNNEIERLRRPTITDKAGVSK